MSDKTNNIYFFKQWQNIANELQLKDETLDDFTFWLLTDYDFSEIVNKPLDEEEIRNHIGIMINKFLGRDTEKIKAGELELLKNWKGD